MYLFEVKKPAESKGPWDYYKLRATIPADQAFRPLDRGRLPAGRSSSDARRAAGRRRRPAGSQRTSRMIDIFGIPPQALFGQLLLGLINGSFYAMLSLGLAVIFGLLNIINFTHGAQYMMGAFVRLDPAAATSGIGYWWALLLAPLVVGAARHRDRAHDAAAALQARPPLRPAADLRPGADHRGRCSATSSARRACPTRCPTQLAGGTQPRLHVPAELPRLGDRRLARRLPRAPGS